MPLGILQFASRLFLHDYPKNYFSKPWEKLITPVQHSKILLLLGDIGFIQAKHTHDFIHYCSKNWDNVFWLEGQLEQERNPDGIYCRPLPSNVIFLRKSAIYSLEISSQPSQPSPVKQVTLYLNPFHSYHDMKFLRYEDHKDLHIVATYTSMPHVFRYNQPNCLGWFSGISQDNSIPTVNMYKNKNQQLEPLYNPSKIYYIFN